MSKVINISSDRKMFEEGSAVRARMVEYASLFEELHIVVFNTGIFTKTQIASNAWIYPTNSLGRWFYAWGAVRLGSSIIGNWKLEIRNCVITSQDPFECGLAAYKIAKRFKLPLHIQIHTDFLSPFFASASLLNRVRIHIAKRVLRRAAAIRVVSQRIFDSLRELRITNYESRTRILPIFTDLEKFRTAKPSPDLKQKYSEWSFIILAVGRFSPEKNFIFAIRVLKKLLEHYPKTGLLMVGDGPLRGALERAAFREGLLRHIAFEPWQSDLFSYYKTANLFLQSSLYEGFGLALLEAVASGCPAVSSDVGIAPELLSSEKHSFVCPVNDLDCFVRTVSELIENNQLRELFSLDLAPLAVGPFNRSKETYLEAYRASIESARE